MKTGVQSAESGSLAAVHQRTRSVNRRVLVSPLFFARNHHKRTTTCPHAPRRGAQQADGCYSAATAAGRGHGPAVGAKTIRTRVPRPRVAHGALASLDPTSSGLHSTTLPTAVLCLSLPP